MATNNAVGNGLTGSTGSGAFVGATSPTLVTPVLGVASATTINKVTLTTPATASTLTIADGKTLTASNTLTFTGTDSSSVAFGAGGTVSYAVLDVWVAYTPTLSAGFGTATNVTFYSRRNGSNLDVFGRFTCGTVAASVATITLGYNGTNSNVTTSSIIPTLMGIGNVVGTVAFAGAIYVTAEPSVGVINFGIQNGSNSGLAKSNGSAVFNTGSTFTVQCSVPITGW